MNIETFTGAILRKMTGIGKVQTRFFLSLCKLLLGLRGRYTFLNFGRYGSLNELSYRRQFEKDFDFRQFNEHLIAQCCSKALSWVFDPSFLSKSGQRTPGVGYFWSGCAGAMKRGLEISGLALADMVNHTAFHYHAVQTAAVKGEQNLLAWYTQVLLGQIEALKKQSKILVVDAFFSKNGFIDALCAEGMTLVSRMRKDCYIRYAYTGEQKKGRGRPKTFGGKLNPKNVSTEHFQLFAQSEKERLYEGRGHIRSLGRWCRIVVRQTLKDGQVKQAFVYFSTDETMSGEQVLAQYEIRFQIEFLYRDAKQHLGLNHCQSRQPEAIAFHINLSLTMLNLAKALHWMPIAKESRPPFSMADIKTQYINEQLLDRLIRVYGKDPNVEKNNPDIRKIYDLGKIAA